MTKRTIVIGLDGASWNNIDPIIDKLPTIGSLKENGTWGTLKSCLPPYTIPAWKCYSTGLNPGTLNVFGFTTVDFREKRLRIINSRSFRHLELWDYLNWIGVKTAIVNMPTMYPPKPIDGYIVGGFDALEDYTYPPGLKNTIERHIGYQVFYVFHAEIDDSDDVMNELLNMTETRFQVARMLEKKVNFLHLTIYHTDRIMHKYGDRRDAVIQIWQLVDRGIQKLIEGFDDVLLMSDHGHTPTKRIIPINEWLEDKGYLRTLSSGGMRRRDIEHSLPIIRHLPKRARRYLKELTRRLGAKTTIESFDWNKTKAVCMSDDLITLNPSNDADTNQEIVRELLTINGMKNIHTPGSLYGLGDSNLLIVEMEDGYGCVQPKKQDSRLAHPSVHKRDGIFVFNGTSFESKGPVGNADIYDLMPTILSSYGTDVESDGRVLTEVLSGA